MDSSAHRRVLIVANRTAATEKLLEQVRERAGQGPCEFTLLVPAFPIEVDPQGVEARNTLELALPLLEEAAGGQVSGAVGPTDAMRAVERELVRVHYDEVIVSTLPERVSQWLKRDLPTRIEKLGVPVTVVRAESRVRTPAPLYFGGP